MKKYILLLGVIFIFSGCRTWTPMMLETENTPIITKLPSLQLYSGTEYYTTILSETEFRLFREEMESNIMTAYGDKFGSAFYSSRIIEEKQDFAYTLFSGLSLYTLNLVGFPLHRLKRNVEIEIRILDLKGRLIGKYKGQGTGKAVVALYYGFDWKSAHDKVLHESITEALKNTRIKINKDAPRLKSVLLTAEKELESIK